MQITHPRKPYAIIFHHLQYSSYDTSNMKTKFKKKNKEKPTKKPPNKTNNRKKTPQQNLASISCN